MVDEKEKAKRNQEIFERMERGEKAADIGKRFGLNGLIVNKIYDKMKREGLPHPKQPTKLPEEPVQEEEEKAIFSDEFILGFRSAMQIMKSRLGEEGIQVKIPDIGDVCEKCLGEKR